jgi:hypothetical protein
MNGGLERLLYYLTHEVDYQLISWFYLIAGLCLIIGYMLVNEFVEKHKPTEKKLTYEENWPLQSGFSGFGLQI